MQGHDVPGEHAIRLSPLIDRHLNVHVRYPFANSGQPTGGLRALRDPGESIEDD